MLNIRPITYTCNLDLHLILFYYYFTSDFISFGAKRLDFLIKVNDSTSSEDKFTLPTYLFYKQW